MRGAHDNYPGLEKRLRELLAMVETDFAPEEVSAVRDFLEAREYGLALETLSAIVVEMDRPLDEDANSLIDGLAEEMGIAGDRIITALHQHLGRRRSAMRL